MTTLTDTIATFDYFANFNLAYQNIDDIRVELNIINSLVGSKNIENDFEKLYMKYPEISKCIPLLLAVREKEIKVLEGDEKLIFNFSIIQDVNFVKKFMRETGLFNLISNKIINSIIDYATGIEIGLGSNGRKNRCGHMMEKILQYYIELEGFEIGKNYFKEMKIKDIEQK